MSGWYRVFGTGDREPRPEALLEQLQGQGVEVTGRFRADDQGWFRAELGLGDEPVPLELERYLSTEEGIRDELNTWAAWLETREQHPHHLALMQHMIGTKQVFTVRWPSLNEARAEPWCSAICRFLARQTEGVCQADGRGFFDADGILLVPEQ